MHTTSKRITHCKQDSRTLQTKLQYAANKRIIRCKQNSSMLQTKELHAANKTPAHCKQKNHMLQTKAKLLCAQDDVKDWDLVSWFSCGDLFMERNSRGCHKNSDPSNFFCKERFSKLASILIT